MVDSHLRILARDGVISPALRDGALAHTLQFRDFGAQPAVVPAIQSKAVNMVRNRLATLLETPLYELDRMDLSVDTTLDYPLQQQVTAKLRVLSGYLEVVAELYDRYAGMEANRLEAELASADDTIHNFKREDNFRYPTLREALRESINLPFVRLLRELVEYHIAYQWHDIDQVLHNDADPRRQQVLAP